jgi:excinuclease ABC subunit C
VLPLDSIAAFDPASTDKFFAALPPLPAVFLVEPRAEFAGARPVLLRTADLARRMRLLLGPPDPRTRRLNLRDLASGIRFRVTGSKFEQALVLWQHARSLWPSAYRRRLRLRPASLVKLNLSNPYPRAYSTRRVGADGLYFGPFASRRAAEAFLEPFQDLFRLRRCQIKIRRDPAFPGCIYSEMKMCLAPCFAGCSDADYGAERDRVVAFLTSRGVSLTEELERDREAASAALDFERAAAVHRRLEKVDALARLTPEVARRVDRLDAVVLARAAQRSSIAVFVVRAGRIADPFLIEFAALASQPRSAEEILRQHLESVGEEAAAVSVAEREDHLALLARWFYARPREGEIFFADRPSRESDGGPAVWPYRRLIRACSRVLAGAAAPEENPPPAQL